MGHSPSWKIYDSTGHYVGSVKYPLLGAVLLSHLGHGATIRWGHQRIAFTEGVDGQAGESYDQVAIVCRERIAKP